MLKETDFKSYSFVQKEKIDELNGYGYVLEHKKTGARVLLIENDDTNKVFSIAFRTPPADDSGVAHILEHSVLCGSDKFPSKDPFIELAKGSLNTFLNAMTYPDKTVYPIASCNAQDYHNLMHVYLDAVFHPNIYKRDEILKQEGWHYEIADKDDELKFNGVVYNEMKGAFSSPDDVLSRQIMTSLFPDTTYANVSGGDPLHIPELTYEEYLDFHRRYYHPCNSYIYLYGDMDVAEKLAWMDEAYLGKYEAIGLDSEIKLQKPFEKPIEVTHKYSISSTESEENNTYLSYNTVIETALDEKLYLAFDILDYALVSAPGAPLKQALIDAGIGSEITGGYDSGTLQPTFSVIAKNTNPQEKEHFLAVIRETLEGLVKNGLNKKSLLAGINSSEFRYREADFGHFPKGLLYGIQCLDSWLYDDMRPFLHLEALDTYRFLKEQVETDYFERLIQKYLLNNKHASVVIIEPEKGLNAKNEAALEKKLAEYKAGLSEDEIRKLIADTKHLKEYQETPSPKEDLEKIPMLARSDMKKEAAPFYNTELSVKGIPVVHHDIYSNGIIYLTMLFDIAHIPAEDIPYLGVLKAVLGYVDTKNYSYADFANEVNIHTGGISSTIGVYPSVKDKDDYQVKFEVRTKALYDKLPEAATLMKEMLFTSNIDDEKRLYEIIAELKSRLQVSISSAGHSVASTRAMTYFSKAAAYKDTITFYETLCDLEAHFDERKEALTAKLKEMVSSIFTKEHLLVSVTCEKDGLSIVETELEKFIPMLYETSGEEKQAEIVPVRKNEGFMDASQVLYVARAGNFRAHGFDYHGALRILKVIMEYDYLWINIRVKGGAYGCMNGYMKNGDTYFVSYRDPNLEKTNEIYDGIPAYIEQFTADERDMTKYIIGTISDMDVPMNPSTKGDRSMAAYLQNISYEEIQKERDQVIGATQEDIRGLRDMIASVLAENNLCVVGNEETLQASEGMFGEVKHLNESER